MKSLISVAQFRESARAGRNPRAPVFRVNVDAPDDVLGKPRTKRFTFSDGSVDRLGDTINPNGWDLADFKRNPVALFSHDSMSPPIGRASNVGVVGNRLMGDVEFATPEIYEFADTIFKLVDGGFLRACSVGFVPLEWSFVDNDPDRGFGVDFKRQILLEISVCPIPANPNALSEARSIGIDTRGLSRWAERALDSGGTPVVSHGYLSRLRADAREPPRARGATYDRAADLARARAIKARIEGGRVMRVHQWTPPPAPTPAEEYAEAERQRRVAGIAAANAATRSW